MIPVLIHKGTVFLLSGFDFVAASFVKNTDYINQIRELANECNSSLMIIAKIENQEGIENIDSIIEAADGIMVARGDMGVEIPAERVPFIQKTIIKCYDPCRVNGNLPLHSCKTIIYPNFEVLIYISF